MSDIGSLWDEADAECRRLGWKFCGVAAWMSLPKPWHSTVLSPYAGIGDPKWQEQYGPRGATAEDALRLLLAQLRTRKE